jgi:hypothetical protein
MRFSRQRVWGWLFSGMLRRIVWYKLTDVSEVLAASIIRAMSTHHTDDGVYMAIFIRRLLVKTPIPDLLKIRSVVKIWSMWTISWFCVHLCTLETTHQNVFNGISYLGEGRLRLYVNIRILDKYRSFSLLNKTSTVRFQVLMAASMKMTAFGV